RQGRRKFFGRAGAGSVGMGPLLEALGRLLRRGMTPAVLVALPVGRAREIRELVGEGALPELLTLRGEAEAIPLHLEVALLGEANEELAQGGRRYGEEARELRCGGPLDEALGAHPVHRLEYLLANLKRLELAHGVLRPLPAWDPPAAPLAPTSF